MLRVPPLSKKCCCCGAALELQQQITSALVVHAENCDRRDFCSECALSDLKTLQQSKQGVQAIWTINRAARQVATKQLPDNILEVFSRAEETAIGIKWLLGMFLHRLGYLALVQEDAAVSPMQRVYEVIDTGALIQVIFSSPSLEARALLEQIARDIPQEAKAS